MDGETEGATDTGTDTTDDSASDSDQARESDEAFQALQRILAHAEQHGESYPGATRDVELVRERIGK